MHFLEVSVLLLGKWTKQEACPPESTTSHAVWSQTEWPHVLGLRGKGLLDRGCRDGFCKKSPEWPSVWGQLLAGPVHQEIQAPATGVGLKGSHTQVPETSNPYYLQVCIYTYSLCWQAFILVSQWGGHGQATCLIVPAACDAFSLLCGRLCAYGCMVHLYVPPLGTHAKPCCWLNLGTWSCSGLAFPAWLKSPDCYQGVGTFLLQDYLCLFSLEVSDEIFHLHTIRQKFYSMNRDQFHWRKYQVRTPTLICPCNFDLNFTHL